MCGSCPHLTPGKTRAPNFQGSMPFSSHMNSHFALGPTLGGGVHSGASAILSWFQHKRTAGGGLEASCFGTGLNPLIQR